MEVSQPLSPATPAHLPSGFKNKAAMTAGIASVLGVGEVSHMSQTTDQLGILPGAGPNPYKPGSTQM